MDKLSGLGLAVPKYLQRLVSWCRTDCGDRPTRGCDTGAPAVLHRRQQAGKQLSILLQCPARVSLFLQVCLRLFGRLWRTLLTWFVVTPRDHTCAAPTLLFLSISAGPQGLPKVVPLQHLHLSHTWAHLSCPSLYSLHGDAYLLILTFPR